MRYSLTGSPWTIFQTDFLGHIEIQFAGVSNETGGLKTMKNVDFRPLHRTISDTVGDTTHVTNRIRAFDW